MMQTTAALFENGRSQAVRLPKAMRFEGKRVLIEKLGDAVILKPLEKKFTQEFWDCLGKAGGDFERPVHIEQIREDVFP